METKPNINSEIGLYAPLYYRDFHCIADRCRHSCCIGWEIAVDGAAYEKYKEHPELLHSVEEAEDGRYFALSACERCPHLLENGLCHIILSYGEDYLTEICRHHPRFYNSVGEERVECGLGLVCEEAARLILTDGRPFSLVKVAPSAPLAFLGERHGFDPLPTRDRILNEIGRMTDFDAMTDALQAEYSLRDLRTPDEWLDFFLSLEILDSDWEADLRRLRGRLFRTHREFAADYGIYYARLLGYFVYRHVSTADGMSDLRARLFFAMLSVRLIRSLFEDALAEAETREPELPPLSLLIDLARRYSAEIEYSEDNTAELIFAAGFAVSQNEKNV